MIGICVACASRPANSETSQNNPSVSVPSATQTSDSNVSDQSPCSLTMDQAPVLNGLAPGMTAAEVVALFPGSSEDAEVRSDLSRPPGPVGTSSFVIRPDKFESKQKFSGINQITFNLLDGRVANFRIGYDGPEYSHVDKFVAKFTEGTNLPPADAWEAYVGLDNSLKILKCKNFEIQVFAGGQGGNLNYAEIRDLKAEKTLKERRDKARQKATP